MNLKEQEIEYRVLYADTDAMGVMYYANYLRLYEAGRSDFMRKLGFSFNEMKKLGIVCPAIKAEIEYKKFVEFDSIIKIRTIITEKPKVKLYFNQKIIDESNHILNIANISLGFVNTKTNKATRCPKYLSDIFEPYF